LTQTQLANFWKIIITHYNQEFNSLNFYQQQVCSSSEYDEDIRKDLDRTLPQSEVFQAEEK